MWHRLCQEMGKVLVQFKSHTGENTDLYYINLYHIFKLFIVTSESFKFQIYRLLIFPFHSRVKVMLRIMKRIEELEAVKDLTHQCCEYQSGRCVYVRHGHKGAISPEPEPEHRDRPFREIHEAACTCTQPEIELAEFFADENITQEEFTCHLCEYRAYVKAYVEIQRDNFSYDIEKYKHDLSEGLKTARDKKIEFK